MSAVATELYPWVLATRGALEWLIETGDVDLDVPTGFVLPAFGQQKPGASPWSRPAAPTRPAAWPPP